MFQTHCYDSWLGGAARDSGFFKLSQLGGTLPAPLFLFLAGVSFALVTDKLRQKGVSADEIARTTILRGGEIFLLALLFRLQEFLLGHGPCAVDGPAARGCSQRDRSIADDDGRRLPDRCRGREPPILRRLRKRTICRGGRLRRGHRRAYAAAVDHLAAALARVVARVLHQRSAHIWHAATLAVSDFSVGRIRVCGIGGWLFVAIGLGAQE